MVHIFICPGFHAPALTDSFLQRSHLRATLMSGDRLWIPPHPAPIISGYYLRTWMQQCIESEPVAAGSGPVAVMLISFSAGVVGAIAAATSWQQQGGKVAALVAIDGWGVPLLGRFPIYRLSHDRATHEACRHLGGGRENFYANPSVPHLELWRSPDLVTGDRVTTVADHPDPQPTTAALFIQALIARHRHGDNSG